MHAPVGIEWIIILVIVLLVFGPSKLPQLAKGLGQAKKEFKEAAMTDEEKAKAAAAKTPETKTDDTKGA
ncbi:MAG TPA: twin-arginine translocase TatA/TatE family subunit [Fibrobacteria bacterium]|jgi:sec-independent protein translocase protein TatA|nr:twin-arginine translocase TatA/TatE family subunit [Fibrobacteria bacterium]